MKVAFPVINPIVWLIQQYIGTMKVAFPVISSIVDEDIKPLNSLKVEIIKRNE